MNVHGYLSLAEDLQNEFGDFLDVMETSLPEIFIKTSKYSLEEIKQKWINDPLSLTNITEQKTPPSLKHSKWKVEFIRSCS